MDQNIPVVVLKQCPMCGVLNTVQMTQQEYARWEGGELLQSVVPTWTAEQRELLISGIDQKCWSAIFGKEA